MSKKYVSNLSLPSTKSELDLFEVPPTQVVVEKTKWKEVHLSNPCTNDGPYTFHIPPDPQMLQFAKNYLLIELRIVNADGTDLDKNSPMVAPINAIGKTLFRQVKLALNNTDVFDSGDKYAYRAYLETELNFGSEAKQSQLSVTGYSQEEPDNAYLIDSDDNPGFKNRANNFKYSRWVQLMSPVHCDLFAQDRYMLNNIDVRLQLHRNTDAFTINCHSQPSSKFKIEIRNMKWYVKTVSVISSLSIGLERALSSYTAKYPIRRVEVKSFHIDAGRRDAPENALFSGQIPRRLIIGCVEADAYDGASNKSPFNFKNFAIREISVTAAGEVFPSQPLRMDFSSPTHYSRAYIQLFEGLGMGHENKGNGITPLMFKYGSCIFAFDLSPDEDDGNHFDLIREGSTTINIHFTDPVLTPGVEVICYAEYDNLLEIDRNRNVYIDYRT